MQVKLLIRTEFVLKYSNYQTCSNLEHVTTMTYVKVDSYSLNSNKLVNLNFMEKHTVPIRSCTYWFYNPKTKFITYILFT